MADLQINLPDATREFAAAQIAAGRFGNMSDYVGALVSADEQMQQAAAKLGQNPRLETLLEEGLRSGAGRAWSPAVLSELKQQVLDRVAGKSE